MRSITVNIDETDYFRFRSACGFGNMQGILRSFITNYAGGPESREKSVLLQKRELLRPELDRLKQEWETINHELDAIAAKERADELKTLQEDATAQEAALMAENELGKEMIRRML